MVFYLNIYSCDDKAEFSASLLQSSVSHDPSEIILTWWFDVQETFIIINVENSFYSSLMNRKFQKQHLLKSFVTLWMSSLSLLINLMHPR